MAWKVDRTVKPFVVALPAFFFGASLVACGDDGDPASESDVDGDGFDTPADCDDDDDAIHPDAPEMCDGVDNDCDGTIDVGALDGTLYWQDLDHDGYGATKSSSLCEVTAGWVANDDDCDDTRSDVNPNAREVCDPANVDEDCDLLVNDDDEDPAGAPTFYEDADGDGFGNDDVTATVCVAPSGYVALAGDCDDAAADVNPLAIEQCGDAIDHDCDGTPSCALHGEVSVADADLTLTGAIADDDMGHDVAAAGDVNGDGVGDLVVTSDYGVGAFLFLGPLTTSTTSAAVATITNDGEYGSIRSDAFPLGDQDSDGYDDFVLPSAEWAGGIYPVRWYVFLGPTTGALDAEVTAAATIDAGFNDGSVWASSSGDVNGDGIVDALLGAAEGFSEAAYLFLGPTTGDRTQADADALFVPSDFFDHIGAAVCADGDLDGDGVDDVLVTADSRDWGPGRAGVFLGPVVGQHELDEADVVVRADDTTNGFGWRATTSGDLGGDGTDDLAIGSLSSKGVGTVYVLSDIGAVAEMDVTDADAIIEPDPSTPGLLRFGYQINSGSDVDGDAIDDLTIAETPIVDVTGSVWGFHGPLSGTLTASADAAFSLLPKDPKPFFARSVALVPDVTGDGFDDIAVGAPTLDTAGAVYVFVSGP